MGFYWGEKLMTASEAPLGPPALMFSHFGINVDDADKLEDFYTRVLGFCVSDCTPQ